MATKFIAKSRTNPFKAIITFLTSRVAGMIVVLLLVVALPITVFISKQQTVYKEHAQTPLSTNQRKGGDLVILGDSITLKAFPNPTLVRGISAFGFDKVKSDYGLQHIKEYLDKYPNSKFFGLGYGANDSAFGVSVYTFHNNLQNIINIITDNGAIAVLAMIPAPNHKIAPNYQYNNYDVRKYNDVVTSLIGYKNSIAGPDFYTMFNGHSDYYDKSDGVHPNATGQEAIRNVWKQVQVNLLTSNPPLSNFTHCQLSPGGCTNGNYCGNDGPGRGYPCGVVNGNSNILYHCNGSTATAISNCSTGCHIGSWGTNDTCNNSSNTYTLSGYILDADSNGYCTTTGVTGKYSGSSMPTIYWSGNNRSGSVTASRSNDGNTGFTITGLSNGSYTVSISLPSGYTLASCRKSPFYTSIQNGNNGGAGFWLIKGGIRKIN